MRFVYTAAAILTVFAWDFSQNYGQMFWWLNAYAGDTMQAFGLT